MRYVPAGQGVVSWTKEDSQRETVCGTYAASRCNRDRWSGLFYVQPVYAGQKRV